MTTTFQRLGRTLLRILPAVVFFPLMHSCFTGIESTPKISYKDVRREDAGISAEEEYGRRFRTPAYRDWNSGDLFLVADSKADMAYTPQRSGGMPARKNDLLRYCGTRSVPSIVGGTTAELLFVRLPEATDTLIYRPGVSEATLRDRESFHVPFLVNLQAVSTADELLHGRYVYTRTTRWLDDDSREIDGRKFLKVRIDSVLPYDENYPYMVCFSSAENTPERGALLMAPTPTDDTPALRGFATLFLLSDPRTDYPQITDENWQLIRRGRVAEGMTQQEARLALGAPKEVDRAHDRSFQYERWGYSDGLFLIFEDGILTRLNR